VRRGLALQLHQHRVEGHQQRGLSQGHEGLALQRALPPRFDLGGQRGPGGDAVPGPQGAGHQRGGGGGRERGEALHLPELAVLGEQLLEHELAPADHDQQRWPGPRHRRGLVEQAAALAEARDLVEPVEQQRRAGQQRPPPPPPRRR
jgi:hypothetical protein